MDSDDKPWHSKTPGGKGEKEVEGEELDITKLEGCFASVTPNKRQERLVVVRGDGSIDILQYHHLDARGRFQGGKFVIPFAGTKFWELRVEGFGPRLWRVCDLIAQHRMPYIRQATEKEAKFAKDGETLLTKIDIVDVTPKEA